MLEKVKKWIKQNNLFVPGEKVVAACSGGADSLALVHILHTLSSDYNIMLVVAHVDHMLRGEESAADARFVAAYCRQQGLPYYQTAIDVASLAASSGRSIEDEARQRRYEYLRQIASKLGDAKIATGHHRDDQAETVLTHLFRGAGSMGIRGMLPLNAGIARPLLVVSRSEIEKYCQQQDLNARCDSSNLQMDYLRNRIRLQLMPMLESAYNPAIKEALCRTATIVGAEHDYIRCQAENLWAIAAERQEDCWLINTNMVCERHIALQREFFRLAIEKIQGSLTGISFYHVERLIDMASAATVGAILELPGGLLATRDYSGLRMELQSGRKTTPQVVLEDIMLKVPGLTPIPQLNCTIATEVHLARPMVEQGKQIAVFDLKAIALPLYVRTRLPGDRFAPLGMNGSKKLKEFLIDAKIPRFERSLIPVVFDRQGILWLAGHRQAERGKVADNTTEYLQMTMIKTEAEEQDD